MCSLDRVNINEKVTVVNINNESLIKRRLVDIGIIPGMEIEKVLISPFGGISAYEVMDSLIAIRDDDAKCIEVCYE